MRRYEHGGDIYTNPGIRLDFSVSTNPIGMPDEVCRALASRIGEFARYPDPQCRALRAAIARHENTPEAWVLCGNGAADLIYRLCYAIKPRRALVCAPAFSEYERALKQVDCRVTCHVLQEENAFALTEEIEKQIVPGVEMLFLCHPNNPTGQLISENVLRRVLGRAKETGTIIVVDECFLGFTNGASSKRYLDELPGLIVLKAFTKLYAMAGLRLGYLLCANRALLNKLAAAAQCWSVSVPAQIAGVAALDCTDWPDKTRRLAVEERRFLTSALRALGITVFPSDANFFLLRCKQPLAAPLLKKGILIRNCGNFRALGEHDCRIGVKTRAENDCLIRAVKEVLHG